MTLNYYTELLSRIRSISIIVEEEHQSKTPEVVSISQVDPKLIKLSLKGYDSPLYIPLPSEVPQVPNISKCASSKGSVLSIRLPLSDVKLDRSTNESMIMSTNYKWNSTYLKRKLQKYSFNCLQCDTKLLESQNIESVLDLPSSLWAEMMDFWHCHKPEDEGSPLVVDKFKQFKPKENGILTGPFYIAINMGDDYHKLLKDGFDLKCKNCEAVIGESSEEPKNKENLDRLFYWNLRLSHNKGQETYKPYYQSIESIMENVNGSATRIIEFRNFEETKSLLVWVFNIGLDVVVKDIGILKNSLKIYYTNDPQDIEEERRSRGEIEVVDVQDSILSATIHRLSDINAKLPRSIRSMGKHWKLALLSKDEE